MAAGADGMRTVHFHSGETVFRTGEPSGAVYVIDRGDIAIVSGDGPYQVEIARLHEGDLFGESGVLENRPRSASAIAITEATVLETDSDTFLKAFGVDNDRALSLLKLLCRRLRSTTQEAARTRARLDNQSAEQPAASALRLVPDSEWLADLIGAVPIEIRRLPFQVGNRYGGEVSAISTEHNFCIPAAADTGFSAPHFEILRRGADLVIRDLSRRTGTLVNGDIISRHSTNAVAPLKPGINRIIAGQAGSPFRFKLVVAKG